MNSNSDHARLCWRLKRGPRIPAPSDPDAKSFIDWGHHPEDQTYMGAVPPLGLCRNRYCPHSKAEYGLLIRGYCGPCAEIRKRPGRNKRHRVDHFRVRWGSLAGIDRDRL